MILKKEMGLMNFSVVDELITGVDEAVDTGVLAKVYNACAVLDRQLAKIDVDDAPAEIATPYLRAAQLVADWAKDVRGAKLSEWKSASSALRRVVANRAAKVGCDENEIVRFWSDKKYAIVNKNMGSGAFGRAVLLRDMDAGILLVAKVYDPVNMSAENRARFYQFFKLEIKILHAINHRNIVRIYASHLYESRQSGIILMEYIDGKTLDRYVKEYDNERDDVNAAGRERPIL